MPPSQSLVPFYVLAGLIIVAVWFTYQLYNYGMAVKTESKTILERHNVKVSRTGAVLSVKDSMVMEENRADKGQSYLTSIWRLRGPQKKSRWLW